MFKLWLKWGCRPISKATVLNEILSLCILFVRRALTSSSCYVLLYRGHVPCSDVCDREVLYWHPPPLRPPVRLLHCALALPSWARRVRGEEEFVVILATSPIAMR